MTRKTLISGIALAIALGAAAFVFLSPKTPIGRARIVNQLATQNLAARGGNEVWGEVSSLRLAGHMDVGKGMSVPYVLEQKRPGKMRLEFVFDGETAVQSTDGTTGWKLEPFRGKKAAEPMTEEELREVVDAAEVYGVLFDYADRGHEVELLGSESVNGREANKLKVTLPGGAVRWLYVDAETGLELKLEALRTIGAGEQLVETVYSDWQPTEEGLLIARRQETRIAGAKESQVLTVESVTVNPPIDDSRFAMPASAQADTARTD